MRYNTKFTIGPGKFEVQDFPPELDARDGLVAIPATIDPTVGQEVALYWLDRTPFIHELARVRPFRLFMRSGLFRSDFGPLIWLLFYVPNPQPQPQPFASMECHINPCNSNQVAMWQRLANQTHWHLTLLGAGNKIANFFEFENTFQLDEALDVMKQACRDMQVTDFMAAKRQFWDSFTMDDLYAMD
jgi:hypothetical protein